VSSVTLLDNGFQQGMFLCFSVHVLAGDNHLPPTSYCDRWLQVVLPSAASSWAGLISSCQPPTSAVNSRMAGLIFRVIVTLRLAVYRQSVNLGAKHLEAHGQRFILANEPLMSLFFCNILSDERMGESVMNRLGLCQVYVSLSRWSS
jgi:hypothetical protein